MKDIHQAPSVDFPFRKLMTGIDTTSPTGKLLFTIFSSLAQFERDVLIERTHEGLAAARARGRNGGRPKMDVL